MFKVKSLKKMSDNENESADRKYDYIAHATIKPPKFLDTNPSAYFCIFEAQFNLKNITSSATKFYNVVAALPSEVVGRLSPAVIATASYEELKAAVVNIYEKTKPEILNNLMKQRSLSGRPSLYLNEMLTLAEKIQLGEDIVRHQFIQALPSTISPIIASQKGLNLLQLGELADELLPYFNSQSASTVKGEVSSQHQAAVSNAYPYEKSSKDDMVTDAHVITTYPLDYARMDKTNCQLYAELIFSSVRKLGIVENGAAGRKNRTVKSYLTPDLSHRHSQTETAGRKRTYRLAASRSLRQIGYKISELCRRYRSYH